jgi:hypothetical protein
MVSLGVGPDRNRKGARGVFGPPKIKKSYISDFFLENYAYDFDDILHGCCQKSWGPTGILSSKFIGKLSRKKS